MLILMLGCLMACSQGAVVDHGLPFSYESPRLGAGAKFVHDAAEAQTYLTFTVRSPRFHVPLARIWVDDSRIRELRGVSFVYHFSNYGTVQVSEVPALSGRIANGAFVALSTRSLVARATTDAFTPGAASVVPIRGTQGLLIRGQGIGRLEWIEDGILFSVGGSALSPTDAQSLAAAL